MDQGQGGCLGCSEIPPVRLSKNEILMSKPIYAYEQIKIAAFESGFLTVLLANRIQISHNYKSEI